MTFKRSFCPSLRLFTELDSSHYTRAPRLSLTYSQMHFSRWSVLCCSFAVGSSFQHQADILLAVNRECGLCSILSRDAPSTCADLRVNVSTLNLHSKIQEEAGTVEPARWTLIFPRWFLSVRLHMLLVTFSPVFLSFNRNRGTQLLAYFCLFCWFWHDSFLPNGGPSWVTYLEILSTRSAPSVPDQLPFPKACPFVSLPGGMMPLEVSSFLLTKPLQLFQKQDPAQALLVDLASVNCIINNCAYEMPMES